MAGRSLVRLLAAPWTALVIAGVLTLGLGLVATGVLMPKQGTLVGPSRDDAAAVVAMDAATSRLRKAAVDADALATVARGVLSAVTSGDAATGDRALAQGSVAVATLGDDLAALGAAVDAVPGAGAGQESRLSPDVRSRYDALVTAAGLGAGLADRWTGIAARARDGLDLATLLARHDQETGAAAKLGVAGRYDAALAALDVPARTIAEARALRARLAATVDVTTLTYWLDSNDAYDAALRGLYRALLASGGVVTAAVRTAAADEATARAALPPDDRGLTVILADVARGGLDRDVAAIVAVHAALVVAIDRQVVVPSATAG